MPSLPHLAHLLARAPIDGDFGPDPMVNPRIPFPMIMLFVGMLVVFALGMACSGRQRGYRV